MSEPGLPNQRRPNQRRPKERNRYDIFLGVAGDLDRVHTAYDAELMVSTMLGAAYAVAATGRAAVLTDTAAGLRSHLARRRTRPAVLLRTVLAALAGTNAATPSTDPPWLAHVAKVRPTGTFVFGDTYLAAFAYDDETDGGPDHVVAARVDGDRVTDLFVAAPAAALLAKLAASEIELTPTDPGKLRAVVERCLAVTDDLPELPDARSLTSDRALAAHRLGLLPDNTLTVADFRSAPEAARLTGTDEETLVFAIGLIADRDDPLHWTPETVEEFLLDLLPARAVLDRKDIEVLPRVLSAWVRWAGRVSGGSARAVAETVAAVARHRAEFARRARSDEHRSPAARAMRQLLADGVDVNDEAALAAWLDDYNAREPD